jgi:23S rRNA pseudouridine1911/1915/1917 synthase
MIDEGKIVVSEEMVGTRLDALADLIQCIGSRSQAQKLIKSGEISVNDVSVPGRTRVRLGDTIDWRRTEPPSLHLVPEDIPLNIIHKDDDVIVVLKPAGMVVHPGAGNRTGTLVNALVFHVPELSGVGTDERPGLVHRLDKDTSGLIIVARNTDALRILQEGFADRTVKRRYIVVCQGRRMDDLVTLDTAYGRSKRDRTKFTGRSGTRRAITHFRVLARAESSSIIAASLETGRTHQIRVHLSESGHPVVGDPIYGRNIPAGNFVGLARSEAQILNSAPRLLLHAGILGFPHPRTGEPLEFAVKPPPDFVGVATRLLGVEEWNAVWASFCS